MGRSCHSSCHESNICCSDYGLNDFPTEYSRKGNCKAKNRVSLDLHEGSAQEPLVAIPRRILRWITAR